MSCLYLANNFNQEQVIDLPSADDVEPVLQPLPWVAAWFRASSIVQLLLQLYSNGYTAIDRYFIM